LESVVLWSRPRLPTIREAGRFPIASIAICLGRSAASVETAGPFEQSLK
jgi:hypothetical protein